MYRVDLEAAESLNETAVRLRRRGCKIGNALDSGVANSIVSLISDDWFIPRGLELSDKYTLNLDEYKNNHRVIDICCNSGALLHQFMKRFFNVLLDYKNFDTSDRCFEYIIKNLLYGVCSSRSLCKKIREVLYYKSSVYGNIYHYNILNPSADNSDDFDEFSIDDDIVSIYNSDEKRLVPVKFNVVCGNPPYNNDLYLDFVTLGHRLSAEYDLWITPAKFIGMTSDKNTEFRELFKRIATNVRFYNKATDIFEIQLDGGICCYLNGKSNNNTIMVNNINVNSEDLISFDTNLIGILNKVKTVNPSSYNDSVFNICKTYFCSKQPTEVWETKGTGYYLINDSNRVEIDDSLIKHKDCFNNYKVFCVKVNSTPLAHILDRSEVYGRAAVLMGYGDLDFCKSLKSFFETRTIWYLVYNSGCSNINTASFRFVPDPGSFDCIYEDRPLTGYTPDSEGYYMDSDGNKHCSLYVKYNLTSDEIEMIESVIKTRK